MFRIICDQYINLWIQFTFFSQNIKYFLKILSLKTHTHTFPSKVKIMELFILFSLIQGMGEVVLIILSLHVCETSKVSGSYQPLECFLNLFSLPCSHYYSLGLRILCSPLDFRDSFFLSFL